VLDEDAAGPISREPLFVRQRSPAAIGIVFAHFADGGEPR
jgi:hypothetical protein